MRTNGKYYLLKKGDICLKTDEYLVYGEYDVWRALGGNWDNELAPDTWFNGLNTQTIRRKVKIKYGKFDTNQEPIWE